MLGVQEGKEKGEWKRGKRERDRRVERGKKERERRVEKGKRESERRVEKGKRERERRVERGKREREGKVEKGEEGKGSLKSPVFLSIRLFPLFLSSVCLCIRGRAAASSRGCPGRKSWQKRKDEGRLFPL